MRRIALAAFILLPLVLFARTSTPETATAGVPTDLTLALDCDAAAGIQSVCHPAAGSTIDVDVILTNNTPSSFIIAGYYFTVLNPDTTRLFPPEVINCPTGGPSFDCNPDHNQADFPGGWSCAPTKPDNDTGAGGPGTSTSFISCFNGDPGTPTVAPGASLKLATIHYNVLASAAAGSVALSFADAFINDDQFAEHGSCPTQTVAMTCNGTTITIPELTLAIDCDTVAAGVQSACTVPAGPLMDVGIVFTNSSAVAREINGFSFLIHSPDTARLNPPPIGCSGTCTNSNPNLWDESMPVLMDWDCDPPPPDHDTGADGPGKAVSFIECRNAAETGPTVPPGGSILLATNRYLVPSSAPAGSVALSLSEVVIRESASVEIGSCAPVATTAIGCGGAVVAVAPVTMAIDCSISQPGIQSKCYVSNTLATRDVNFVARNNTNAAFTVGTFHLTLVHLDDSRLFAPPDSTGSALDRNPDFIADTTDLGDWSCSPTDPDNDQNPSPSNPGQRSFISCFNGTGNGPVIAGAATLPLITVRYNIVAGADPGSVFLNPEDGSIFDDTFTSKGGCPESMSVPPMHCEGAELVFYCQIAQADAVHDGRVNSGDLGKVASKFGDIPAPANEDQNFDGMINSGDLGLVASVFNQYVVNCP